MVDSFSPSWLPDHEKMEAAINRVTAQRQLERLREKLRWLKEGNAFTAGDSQLCALIDQLQAQPRQNHDGDESARLHRHEPEIDKLTPLLNWILQEGREHVLDELLSLPRFWYWAGGLFLILVVAGISLIETLRAMFFVGNPQVLLICSIALAAAFMIALPCVHAVHRCQSVRDYLWLLPFPVCLVGLWLLDPLAMFLGIVLSLGWIGLAAWSSVRFAYQQAQRQCHARLMEDTEMREALRAIDCRLGGIYCRAEPSRFEIIEATMTEVNQSEEFRRLLALERDTYPVEDYLYPAEELRTILHAHRQWQPRLPDWCDVALIRDVFARFVAVNCARPLDSDAVRLSECFLVIFDLMATAHETHQVYESLKVEVASHYTEADFADDFRTCTTIRLLDRYMVFAANDRLRHFLRTLQAGIPIDSSPDQVAPKPPHTSPGQRKAESHFAAFLDAAPEATDYEQDQEWAFWFRQHNPQESEIPPRPKLGQRPALFDRREQSQLE